MFLLIIPFWNLCFQIYGDYAGESEAAFLIFTAIWMLWVPGIGLIYSQRVRTQRRPLPDKLVKEYNIGKIGYRHDITDCCVDMEGCAQACCCTCLYARMGDTFEVAQAGNFWAIQVAFFIAHASGPGFTTWNYYRRNEWGQEVLSTRDALGYFSLAVFSLLSFYLALLRRKYRSRLGDTALKGFLCDCMLLFFCTSCVAIQDGRQVDEATFTRLQCCCRLVHTTVPGGPCLPVGEPLKVIEGKRVSKESLMDSNKEALVKPETVAATPSGPNAPIANMHSFDIPVPDKEKELLSTDVAGNRLNLKNDAPMMQLKSVEV